MTRSTGPTHVGPETPTLSAKGGDHRVVDPVIANGRSDLVRPPATASTELNVSQSQQITKKSASNLALAFVLLPKPKRDAMSALYAFCREVDDVADNEEVSVTERRRQLEAIGLLQLLLAM